MIDSMIFFVWYNFKWKIFGFWGVGRTKQDVTLCWGNHFMDQIATCLVKKMSSIFIRKETISELVWEVVVVWSRSCFHRSTTSLWLLSSHMGVGHKMSPYAHLTVQWRDFTDRVPLEVVFHMKDFQSWRLLWIEQILFLTLFWGNSFAWLSLHQLFLSFSHINCVSLRDSLQRLPADPRHCWSASAGRLLAGRPAKQTPASVCCHDSSIEAF